MVFLKVLPLRSLSTKHTSVSDARSTPTALMLSREALRDTKRMKKVGKRRNMDIELKKTDQIYESKQEVGATADQITVRESKIQTSYILMD